jgi:hypothetical protein
VWAKRGEKEVHPSFYSLFRTFRPILSNNSDNHG